MTTPTATDLRARRLALICSMASLRTVGIVSDGSCPGLLPLVLRSPLLPMVQRRLFFGAPLPPLDPAFTFREPAAPGREVAAEGASRPRH